VLAAPSAVADPFARAAAFNPPRLDPARPPSLRPRPRCIVQRQRESPLQITRAGDFESPIPVEPPRIERL
jgi:hypothetical protein